MPEKLQKNLTIIAFFLNLFVTLVSIYLVVEVKNLFVYRQSGLHYNLFWLPLIPAAFTILSFYHWDHLKRNKKHDVKIANMLNVLLVIASILLYFTLPKIAYMPVYQLFPPLS